MANRILLEKNAFKVSKPGADVLTVTAPQDLLIDSQNLSLGSFTTGQIDPPSLHSTSNTNGRVALSIPFSNPVGYLPFIVLQQRKTNDSTTALGPTFEYDTEDQREPLDTVPPRTATFTSYNRHNELSYGVQNNSILVYTTFYHTTALIRYHAFYAKVTDQVYTPQDVSVGAMDWPDTDTPNSSVTSIDQTVSGLGTGVSVVLKVTSSLPGGTGYTLKVIQTGSTNTNSYTFTAGQTVQYLDVTNGDKIAFSLAAADATPRTAVFTITNDTDNNAAIDTVQYRVNYVLNQPNPVNWNNISGSDTVSTNSQTITGINVNITAKVEFSPAYNGKFGINGTTTTYTNLTSTTFTFSNNGSYLFTFQPSANYNGTVTVKNATRSDEVLDTFTANVTLPVDTIVADWANLSATRSAQVVVTVSDQNAPVTIQNLTQTHTLAITLSASGYQNFKVFKNNVAVITAPINGTTTAWTLNVVNNDQIYFYADLRDTEADYSATCTIKDNTKGGVTIDTFTIQLHIIHIDPGG